MYLNAHDVLASVQDTVPFLGIEIKSINQRSIFNDTPLILVMSWDDTEAATLLLRGGADVFASGERGDTALHRAAAFGNKGLVEILLTFGALRSSKNDDGHTPYDLAVLGGHQDIATALGRES